MSDGPVTPDRLRRIAEVLESVLELEESLRGPYLAALARSDLDLVRRVHQLLDAQAEDTVKDGPAHGAPPDEEADSASVSETTVDPASGEIRQIAGCDCQLQAAFASADVD